MALTHGELLIWVDLYQISDYILKESQSVLYLLSCQAMSRETLGLFLELLIGKINQKFPNAFNEVIKFLNQTYFLPNLQKREVIKSNKDLNFQENLIQIQREIIWEELEYLLKDFNYTH